MTYDPLREANPVPFEDSMPSDAWAASVLLDVIDERHALMDVKELAQAPEPETRSNWTAALLAAAAVIVIVAGTLLFVNLGDGENPPADQPEPAPPVTVADEAESAPPTTTAAAVEEPAETPSVADPAALSADEQEFVEAFFAAYNDGRYEEALSFMSPGIRVEDAVMWNGARDRFEETLLWREAMNERWLIESCVKYTSIVCQIEIANDGLSFHGPFPATVRIVIADGVITELIFRSNGSLAETEPIRAFYEWVGERYPDAVIAGGGDPGQPVTTPESTALWVQYLAEYKAEMGFTD